MSKRQVEELNSLIRQRKIKTDSLGPANARQPIPSSTATSTLRERQPDAAGGGGPVSPLTETARTVTLYSDGTHDYYVAVQSTFEDAEATEYVIDWLQPGDPGITVV